MPTEPSSDGRGVARARSVLARWRSDGRLPAATSALLRGWARARGRRAAQRVPAALLPARGSGSDVVTGGGRRWTVAGDLGTSRWDLAHDQASAVVEALQRHGLSPYLTMADGRRLGVGLPAEHRGLALAALAELPAPGPWYLRWQRGPRRGTEVLPSARRVVLRAERWEVHRLHRIAEDAVAGDAEAVELTFWTPGASGRREQLGVRGLARRAHDAAPTIEDIGGRRYPGTSAFPIGRAPGRVQVPIDVVYTWVDGADPTWASSFADWSQRERPHLRGDHAVDPGRYRSRDELRYSLRSLWLNAGWVRKVFVVTAGQRPDWLVEDDRLTVVDHRAIFPDDWLPTFNSHAIEARLHHVPGLGEHFLYLNDDMFLGRPVVPEQFVTGNGLTRFFPSDAWIPVPEDPGPALAVDTAARNGRRLIEETFGRTTDRKLHHAPYALRRSVLAEIEERYPEVVERTARSRFRDPDDLSIPSAFAHHYAYFTGRAIEGSIVAEYQNLENRRLGIALQRLEAARDVDALCLNETEAVPGGGADVDAVVATFLERYFPLPCPWEAPAPR